MLKCSMRWDHSSSLFLLFPGLMAPSTESGRSPTLNKESGSDIIPSLRGDDYEAANTKILRRATLKIDFYLIPIVGMFCVSCLSCLYFSVLISPQICCHFW